MEDRLLSLERQFTALLRCLDKDMHDRMWEEKMVMRKEDGKQYRVHFLIETDKGTKPITIDDVWAWSDKDAIFVAIELHVKPNMDKLQREGKIRFYKIISRKIC